MTIESVCRSLTSLIKAWSKNGLNEAQTSQAIVLRLLEALGYDIWNPCEVFPENHSGGGSGGYKPDYSLHVEDELRFIIEVKALNKAFSDNDKVQAVNYVNAQGLRWAVLTNGREWYFFDNLVAKPAHEKHKLTIDLQDTKAAKYLEKLLVKELWRGAEVEYELAILIQEVDADIRRRTKLSKIERKLSERLGQGFSLDMQGLQTAVQYTLEPNERELAEESMGELAQRLLPEASARTDSAPIEAVIKEGINLTSPRERGARGSDLRAWIDDDELLAVNWRDINAGIAEALLTLERIAWLEEAGYLFKTTEEYRKASGEPYPPSAYRQLSNGRYLLLHASAQEHQRRSRRMLERLDAPPKLIKVVYKEQEIFLP